MALALIAEQNLDGLEEIETLKKDVKGSFAEFGKVMEDCMEILKAELMEAIKCNGKCNDNSGINTKNYANEKVKSKESSNASPPNSSKHVQKEKTKPSKHPNHTRDNNNPADINDRRKHDKKDHKPTSKYLLKPRVLLIGDSIAHNANYRAVEKVTNSTIKTSKAYSSVWDNEARFKQQNVKDVAKKELEKASFEYVILASPSVDITNMDTSNVKPEDPTDMFKKKVESSCKNMLNIAESALGNNSGLKEVIIMNHAPRFDTKNADPVGIKPKLAIYANSFLLELWLDSPHKNRILIASHNLQCFSVAKQTELYREQRSGRYDGVHLYSTEGKQSYTESVINIMLSSVHHPTSVFQANQRHNQSKRRYSDVVRETPIKTQNRFSPLSKNC